MGEPGEERGGDVVSDRYILNDKGEPIPEPNLLKWAQWFEDQQQIGGRTVIRESVGERTVSTVFLGLDYNFGGGGPPVLWETLVFTPENDPLADEMDRCAGTREQAEAMHARMVEKVKNTPTIPYRPPNQSGL